MGISDLIAAYILSNISNADGAIELQRRELAEHFNCVPSQINYVISTRFSPEHGYIVESRRGGGGYIRISRVEMDRKSLLMHVINSLGDEIDASSAEAIISNLKNANAIDENSARLLSAAASENAMRPAPPQIRNALRANIMKCIIINLR